MKYKKISSYSYNLHIIKTNKFKTVTVQVGFKRKLKKEEITYRNMIVNMLCESTIVYPSKRLMTIQTENLYDLYYRGMNYISGKYNVMNFAVTFLNEEYTVTSEFDRMGCRLEGPFIAPKKASDIISDGIAFGSIQVPAHGKPIILLADRQTTGGYAKIATVASVDIPKIVQRKTDHKIKFKAITVQEAQKLYRKELKELDEMRTVIHQPCKEVLDCRLVAKRVSRLFS